MEHIKYGIFDLFVFVIPGAFFLFSSYYIENFDLTHPELMISKSFFAESVSVFQSLTFVAISYVVGFILSSIGNVNLKMYEWLTRQRIGKDEEKSEKYVLVRHFSKANLNYIEMWNMLKNLSSTVASAILLLSIYYFIKFDSFNWLYGASGLLTFFFLLNRAAIYHRWVIGDLNATSKHLEELSKEIQS